MNFHWHDSLITGISKIDAEHKELVHRFGTLLTACEAGKGCEELSALVKFLDDYVVAHIHEEENLQRKHGYPNYLKHKQEHDFFIKELNALKCHIKSDGLAICNVIEINKILLKWLLEHIAVSDKDMGEFLQPLVSGPPTFHNHEVYSS